MKFKKMVGYTASVFALSMLTSLTALANTETDSVDTKDAAIVSEATVEDVDAGEETKGTDQESTPEETEDTTDNIQWESYLAADVEHSLNVRQEPNVDAPKVGILYRGAIAEVLEVGEEWTKIHSGDVEGYVNNKYVVYAEEAKSLANEVTPVVATVNVQGLNVREQADENASVKKVAKEGTQLKVLEPGEEWTGIELGNNTVAYVASEFVTVEQNLEEAKTLEQAAEENRETVQTLGVATSASRGELDLLAAIIQCEAGGESYEGKVAVGAVIMNRVNSGSFPNTITDVVYQSGQFTPASSGVLSGVLSSGARSDCYQAAQDVLNGANNVGGRLFFHSGRGNGLVIGNQTFY
ncbi:MAG TPA: cell wall hydrolase [Candidatus Merdenecus merdavium]|nr:cell wall hydrolase [Candidatus Merdenecus merdavium]